MYARSVNICVTASEHSVNHAGMVHPGSYHECDILGSGKSVPSVPSLTFVPRAIALESTVWTISSFAFDRKDDSINNRYISRNR